MSKEKILLAEPIIEKKIISLIKKVLASNFPNEGKLSRILML